MQRRFILKLAAALGAATLFAGVAHADEAIKVGVTGGPHAQMMEVVKQVAAKNGLNIKIVEFSDYVQPNAALAAGDLDANSYQHAPYLDAQVKDRGYKLIRLADTVTFPMGIYSKKVKSLAELQAWRAHRRAERSDQWRPRAAAAAKAGLAQAARGRGPEGDAARYRRQPEEAEDRRTRRGADSALARRRRRRRDQHQLRDGSGAQAERRTRSRSKIRRGRMRTSSRSAQSTRTSRGSRNWSRRITRRK